MMYFFLCEKGASASVLSRGFEVSVMVSTILVEHGLGTWSACTGYELVSLEKKWKTCYYPLHATQVQVSGVHTHTLLDFQYLYLYLLYGRLGVPYRYVKCTHFPLHLPTCICPHVPHTCYSNTCYWDHCTVQHSSTVTDKLRHSYFSNFARQQRLNY